MNEENPICNFEPSDMDESGKWWRANPDAVEGLRIPCDREIEDNDEYCILHVQREKSEDEIEDAIDVGERMDFAYLPEVNLSEFDLSGAVFRFSNLKKAKFSGKSEDLSRVVFRYSNLSFADFSGLTLIGVDFRQSILHETLFDYCECRDIDFRYADLKEAVLSQARLRSGSKIEDARFLNTDLSGVRVVESVIDGYQSILEQFDWNDAGKEYRKWRGVAQVSSLPEQERQMYIKNKHCQRNSYPLGIRRAFAGGSRWIMLYGESLRRIALSSAIIILAAVPIYGMTEGIKYNDTGIPFGSATFFDYLYFSAATFTTLGYGDFAPNGSLARMTAISESLVGAVLIALLVYVLGRRATL